MIPAWYHFCVCPTQIYTYNILMCVFFRGDFQPALEVPPVARGYKKQTLPEVGALFDVTVTQVNQPDLIYIQRLPPLPSEPCLCDDSLDPTAMEGYAEIEMLNEISDIFNEDEFIKELKPLADPVVGK